MDFSWTSQLELAQRRIEEIEERMALRQQTAQQLQTQGVDANLHKNLIAVTEESLARAKAHAQYIENRIAESLARAKAKNRFAAENPVRARVETHNMQNPAEPSLASARVENRAVASGSSETDGHQHPPAARQAPIRTQIARVGRSRRGTPVIVATVPRTR